MGYKFISVLDITQKVMWKSLMIQYELVYMGYDPDKKNHSMKNGGGVILHKYERRCIQSQWHGLWTKISEYIYSTCISSTYDDFLEIFVILCF